MGNPHEDGDTAAVLGMFGKHFWTSVIRLCTTLDKLGVEVGGITRKLADGITA